MSSSREASPERLTEGEGDAQEELRQKEEESRRKKEQGLAVAQFSLLTAIYTMFSSPSWIKILESGPHFGMFPALSVFDWYKVKLAWAEWRDASLDEKSEKGLKLFVELSSAIAASTAIGLLLIAGAAVAPVIFTVMLSFKALYHFGSALWFCRSDPEKAKHHAVAGVISAAIAVATGLALLGGWLTYALIGAGAAIGGLFYVIAQAKCRKGEREGYVIVDHPDLASQAGVAEQQAELQQQQENDLSFNNNAAAIIPVDVQRTSSPLPTSVVQSGNGGSSTVVVAIAANIAPAALQPLSSSPPRVAVQTLDGESKGLNGQSLADSSTLSSILHSPTGSQGSDPGTTSAADVTTDSVRPPVTPMAPGMSIAVTVGAS